MRFFLLLAVIVGTLAVFNPGEDDFHAFVSDRAAEAVSDHARSAGGGLFADVVGSVGGTLAGALARRAVHRQNLLICSIYSIDLDGPDRSAEEWRFLGIAGQFIPLKKPASLDG